MDTLVKETLEKQLKLLSERSEKAVGNELAIYTEQIVKLANLLDPELRSQPYVEALLLDKVQCPHCGAMVRQGNFCELCSGKLSDTCDCWVLSKPFNCGQAKCPDTSLFTNPRLRALLHQPQDDKVTR